MRDGLVQRVASKHTYTHTHTPYIDEEKKRGESTIFNTGITSNNTLNGWISLPPHTHSHTNYLENFWKLMTIEFIPENKSKDSDIFFKSP